MDSSLNYTLVVVVVSSDENQTNDFHGHVDSLYHQTLQSDLSKTPPIVSFLIDHVLPIVVDRMLLPIFL